jgi:hypothetical protein
MLAVTAQVYQLNAHTYLYKNMFTIFLHHLQEGLLIFLLKTTYFTVLLRVVTFFVKCEMATKF